MKVSVKCRMVEFGVVALKLISKLDQFGVYTIRGVKELGRRVSAYIFLNKGFRGIEIASSQFEKDSGKTLVKIEINGLRDRRWKRDVNSTERDSIRSFIPMWGLTFDRGRTRGDGGIARDVELVRFAEKRKIYLLFFRQFAHVRDNFERNGNV